uniref:CCHC-type domain-containing protein n=1 Tax=Fagus sylvatica TaxID=28930 RepID=A0A2N9GM94_FAGSY
MMGKMGIDCDVVEGLQKIRLTHEKEIIPISEAGRGRAFEECMMSVFGRFLTTKSFNRRVAKETLWKAWRMGPNFKSSGGADIRNRIGRFISNDEWKAMLEQMKYLRVRVEVPIDKPLRSGGFVTSSKGDMVWIDYRYERLSSFCYRCGRLGHEERNCYGSGEPKNKEREHGGKRDIMTEDSALITKSMESMAVVGELNHTEEESDRGRAVSEPINEGKEGCSKLGGRGLDSVGDTGAITKEEKEGEEDRGCQANETNFPSRGLVLLNSLLFVKVDSKTVIGEAGTFMEQCKPDMEGDNIDMHHIVSHICMEDSRVWRLMGFYGRLEEDRKWQSWALLDHLNRMASFRWLVIGDFNDILFQEEKMGLFDRPLRRMVDFGDVLNRCDSVDMGFRGYEFTWDNNRGGTWQMYKSNLIELSLIERRGLLMVCCLNTKLAMHFKPFFMSDHSLPFWWKWVAQRYIIDGRQSCIDLKRSG